jgi:hypothetical protein
MPVVMPEGFNPRTPKALALFDDVARLPGRWHRFTVAEIEARWATPDQFRNSVYKAAGHRRMKAKIRKDNESGEDLFVMFVGTPPPELNFDNDSTTEPI